MTDSAPRWDRRQFGMNLASATAALAATVAAGERPVQGQDAAKADKAEKPATEANKPDNEKPAPIRFNPIAVQLEMVVGQYPSDKLTDDGLRMIAQKLASQLANSARLSAFPLSNGDGPGFVFSAYRGS